MLKAWQSISRYLLSTLLEEGLGESDFRVLEVLVHKGPMPVNAIGPKVYLNPGSVSVVVDRLYKKGFVSRVELQRLALAPKKIGKRAESLAAEKGHSQ